MKNFLLSVAFASSLISCSSVKDLTQDRVVQTYVDKISQTELTKQLYIVAADEMLGRDAGKEGEVLARNYLVNYYKAIGISSPDGTDEGYFQIIPPKTFSRVEGEMRNVMAFVKGAELPDEVLVVSSHYDHVGVSDGEIYNGADDNGSGTVALMEIARVVKEAQKKGNAPKRSILFLHVSGEERGLLGSKYYSDNPIFPLANTIANVNIDMIGRVDDEHLTDENYVYIIGSNMLSTDLHNTVMKTKDFVKDLKLDEQFNTKDDPNRFYYRSDHYNFAKHDIPAVFYFNGVHEDYHRPTDTAEKINYPLMTKRVKSIFSTVWLLANADKRPAVDKPTK